MERLRRLFELFEQKTSILHLLDLSQRAQGVSIYIGSESGLVPLDDVSVITAPYESNGQIVGTLGVIGPTRMAYERVIPIVDLTAKLLSNAMTQQLPDDATGPHARGNNKDRTLAAPPRGAVAARERPFAATNDAPSERGPDRRPVRRVSRPRCQGHGRVLPAGRHVPRSDLRVEGTGNRRHVGDVLRARARSGAATGETCAPTMAKARRTGSRATRSR